VKLRLAESVDVLTVQHHVLWGSLLVSREQLASASMIKSSMQEAVLKLTLPQAQHLLLHLSSNILVARGQSAGSEAELASLHASLDATNALNMQLEQRTASLIEQLQENQRQHAQALASVLQSCQLAARHGSDLLEVRGHTDADRHPPLLGKMSHPPQCAAPGHAQVDRAVGLAYEPSPLRVASDSRAGLPWTMAKQGTDNTRTEKSSTAGFGGRAQLAGATVLGRNNKLEGATRFGGPAQLGTDRLKEHANPSLGHCSSNQDTVSSDERRHSTVCSSPVSNSRHPVSIGNVRTRGSSSNGTSCSSCVHEQWRGDTEVSSSAAGQSSGEVSAAEAPGWDSSRHGRRGSASKYSCSATSSCYEGTAPVLATQGYGSQAAGRKAGRLEEQLESAGPQHVRSPESKVQAYRVKLRQLKMQTGRRVE
jgi:hypothetical protein